MSKFTEADKAEVLSTLTNITEYKDKYHVYHVVKDSCDCRTPDNKILPEQEDLLHFFQKKMLDHEVHGHLHERLIKVVKKHSSSGHIPC
jgi:hypothetical protein